MTKRKSPSAAEIAHEKIDRISIGQRAGVWRVVLNDNFYGDYVRKYWALDAAFKKADEIAARGGAATIHWTIDGQQNARLYDTRRPAPRAQVKRAMWPRTRRWPPIAGESFAKRLLEQV